MHVTCRQPVFRSGSGRRGKVLHDDDEDTYAPPERSRRTPGASPPHRLRSPPPISDRGTPSRRTGGLSSARLTPMRPAPSSRRSACSTRHGPAAPPRVIPPPARAATCGQRAYGRGSRLRARSHDRDPDRTSGQISCSRAVASKALASSAPSSPCPKRAGRSPGRRHQRRRDLRRTHCRAATRRQADDRAQHGASWRPPHDFMQGDWAERHSAGSATAISLSRGHLRRPLPARWLGGALRVDRDHHLRAARIDDDPAARCRRRRYSLVVHTADITRNKLVRLPWDYPEYGVTVDTTRIVDAVRASMSIPFFFDAGSFRRAGPWRRRRELCGGAR